MVNHVRLSCRNAKESERHFASPMRNLLYDQVRRHQATVLLLIGFLLANIHVAEAQQAKRVRRVGILVGGSASSDAARINALRAGLRELGYREDKNIVIEYRYAEGKLDRLKVLAAELVRQKCDVIVTAGPAATGAAKEITNTYRVLILIGITIETSLLQTELVNAGGDFLNFATPAHVRMRRVFAYFLARAFARTNSPGYGGPDA